MKNIKFVLGLLLGLTFFLFMGAFTRDWIESTPTDSTVANQIDDFNRYLRVDASDRLKEMIYGFTNGENSGNPGFKELIFKQQDSAPGTTNANEITWYSIDDGSNCGLYAIQESGYTKQVLKVVGSDINFVIESADIPADLIDSVHYAANSIDPEHLVDDFTFDTFPLSPSSAPDADYELANKKYVDDQITAVAAVGDAPTLNDSQPTTMLKAHVYKAQTAGFVNAYIVGDDAHLQMYVSSTDAGPAGGSKLVATYISAGGAYTAGTIFVPKDYYFDVAVSKGTPTIYWTPLISGGGAPIDQD